MDHDDACAHGQMVVLGVATREAAVAQQNVVVEGGVVVVVVVTAEDAHHVASLAHGAEHAAIEQRRARFLHTGAYQHVGLGGGGLGKLGQRDVEEGEGWERAPAVGCGVGTAALAIPLHLVEREPGVGAEALGGGVAGAALLLPAISST